MLSPTPALSESVSLPTPPGCDKFAPIVLWPPIIARYIRIRPIDFHEEIAMRFEFYGPPNSSGDVNLLAWWSLESYQNAIRREHGSNVLTLRWIRES